MPLGTRMAIRPQQGGKNLKMSFFLTTTALAGSMLLTIPARAQDAPAIKRDAGEQAPDDKEKVAGDSAEQGDIIVTGTLIRRTDSEGASPVTVLSMDTLATRGINNVADGLQRLSANGAGTLSEGWNAGGDNFAQGANAVSLRGLTTQYTLTMIDGLRMAPYPIADDGHRNFVDLYTLPDQAIDRIEVLKAGGSSTYGADAVAGVINAIMKKQIVGIHLNASAGLSERGDGGERRFTGSVGFGDLRSQGFNVYVTGLYAKYDPVRAASLDYPFNSGDLSKICDGSNSAQGCMAIPVTAFSFGINRDGTFGGSTTGAAPMVAGVDAAGNYATPNTLLNPDCGAFGAQPITLPANLRLMRNNGVPVYAASQCQQDVRKTYALARFGQSQWGLASRATVRVGDNAEAYIAGSFKHIGSNGNAAPLSLTGQTPPPSPALLATIVLPPFVCPDGVGQIRSGTLLTGGCTAANGVPNPNNPYAREGNRAVLYGHYALPITYQTETDASRVVAGINGAFGADRAWRYSVDFTASQVRVKRGFGNFIVPQRLADMVATGDYNFVEPWKNSQAILDYVAPYNSSVSTSKLWQGAATLGRTLLTLPGGPLQAVVGLQYRWEAIDNPSANPDKARRYDRYYTVSGVSAAGSRNVKSALYEIDAPIVREFEVTASGRYDAYSSGQTNFSPKFGVQIKPTPGVLVRGTWSKGFRIPSFNEAYGAPVTGYNSYTVDCKKFSEYCASHQYNSYVNGSIFLGQTSLSDSKLNSETSTTWTAGIVLEPVRNISFNIGYFSIKINNLISDISAVDRTGALEAYYGTGATNAVSDVLVIPGVPDVNHPTARPFAEYLQYRFKNESSQSVSGIDFGFDLNRKFGDIHWSSSIDASYLINHRIDRADGSIERYAGTLSPCGVASCSGSPKLRGLWSNTLVHGPFVLNGTVYYTSGYDLASIDAGGVAGNCKASLGRSVVSYQNGNPVRCSVGPQWDADLTLAIAVNDRFTFSLSAMNFLNIKPVFDPSAAYHLMQFNPSWGYANAMGRSFRADVRINF
jgi:iron complex outermembrane receptor protein